MPSRALLVALSLVAVVPQLPNTSAIVASVSAYVVAYQRDSLALVADEHTVQHVTTAGAVTAVRETAGELFSVFLPDEGAWMSVHDITEVDGTPVPDHTDVRTLLRSQSLHAIGLWLAASNARYNIGHVTRNFNEPTLALLLFTPAHVADLRVSRARVEPPASGDLLVTLRVRGRDGFSLVGAMDGPVKMDATVIVEPATGRVRQSTITFSERAADATLETTYGFDAHVERWVPVTFIERYVARPSFERTTVTSTFTNYRRFEATGRLVP